MANQILLNMNMVGLLNDEKMKFFFDNVSFQKIAHNTTPISVFWLFDFLTQRQICQLDVVLKRFDIWLF
jgi:hypothetical protein